MKLKSLTLWSALALLVATTACQKQSPAAPTTTSTGTTAQTAVTDAKTGVTLTTPTLVSPADGATIAFAKQPITLVIGNSVTTGSTPLVYTFEVATDNAFGTKVYTKDGVPEGANGQTSLTVDRLAGAQTFFWRAHTTSGSVSGPNSPVKKFTVGPQVVLQAPVLSDPGANASVSQTPTLTVNNVQRSGPVDKVFYRFEVSPSSDFSSLAAVATVQERTDVPYTQAAITTKLTANQTYWWRVQANDPANQVTSPYSNSNPFKVQAEFDLKTATIVLGPQNIANWEQTSTITDAYEDGSNLCIFHDHLARWPPTVYVFDPTGATTVEGNQWVFAKINEQWYGGAADWYRPGQACKAVDANAIGHDAFYQPQWEPLRSWVPRSGETFGVMSTTPARAWPSMSTYDERTNVKLIVWP